MKPEIPPIPPGFLLVHKSQTVKVGDRILIKGEWVVAGAADVRCSVENYVAVIRKQTETAS